MRASHGHGDTANGKKASRSRDRMPESPTIAPCVVGLAYTGGGAGPSAAALILRQGQSESCCLASATPSPSPGRSRFAMRRQLLIWTHSESPSGGLAVAENPDGTACLKPKPSIFHSTFDSLCLSRRRSFLWIAWYWLRYEHEPSAACHRCTMTTPTAILPLAFPSCGMIWPIQKMPRDDAAGFCLAPPKITWQPRPATG